MAKMHLSPPTSGYGYCPFYGGDSVVVNSLFVAASIVWQLVLHLSFDMWLYYVIFCQVIIFFIWVVGLMGCLIVVVNVFGVLLCHDLTTAESRVKVWRW